MKKIYHISFSIMLIFVLVSAAQAAPYSFSFGDSVKYWGENWSSGSWISSHSNDNWRDTIGFPEITGGTGLVDSQGSLTQLKISYTSYSSLIGAGDMFIDANADSNWDYILTSSANIYDVSAIAGGFSAYKGHASNSLYKMSDDLSWGGDYRNDHPYGVDTSALASEALIGSYSFSGFNSSYDDVTFTAFKDLSGSDLTLGLDGQFILAFGATCANDVIYETVNNPVPVPPSVWLFGSGLIGLVGLKRRTKA